MKSFVVLLLIALCTPAVAANNPRAGIEETFDRYKGSIFAVYSRALRENPRLAGKIVMNVDIATTGGVTGCRVLSSTLGSPAFERQICEKVLLMKFPPRQSATTITKPLDFFPAN
jgi:periplasmic protein TonB